jgi:hypothetical protein
MTQYDLFQKTLRGPWKTAGHDTQYRIETTGSTLYLIFMGSRGISKGFSDWVANFDFWPWFVKPYKRMTKPWLAHRGFVKRWKACADVVIADTLSHLADKELVILGYSHGAAIALLAHEWFAYHGYEPRGYGFGSPRVLWFPGGMIKRRLSEFFPVRNKGDIVTHVPFAPLGFMHNQLVNIGKPRMIGIRPHTPGEYSISLTKEPS